MITEIKEIPAFNKILFGRESYLHFKICHSYINFTNLKLDHGVFAIAYA
jgi:hypothetical protein